MACCVCRIYGFYMNGGCSECYNAQWHAYKRSEEASFKNYYLYRSIFVFLSQYFFGMRAGVFGFVKSCPRTSTSTSTSSHTQPHTHTRTHCLPPTYRSLSLVFNLFSFFGSFLSSLYISVAALFFPSLRCAFDLLCSFPCRCVAHIRFMHSLVWC